MFELLRRHPVTLILVLLLHGVLFVALLINVSLVPSSSTQAAVEIAVRDDVEVIDAVAVDAETFDRIEHEREVVEQERIAEALRQEEEQRRAEERARQEEERRRLAEQQRREAEERARQEAIEAAERARREAEAEAARIAEERARAEAEREAAEQARREAERLERERREREEAERQAREEAERRAREERERREREEAERRAEQERELEAQRMREQMEAERQRMAEAAARREAARQQAELESAIDQWRSQVQSVVQRRWRQPAEMDSSDRAIVLVRVNETGRIIHYDIESCAGGSRFCESVQQTMERLSSLPQPPDADAVRGGIRIRFEPD